MAKSFKVKLVKSLIGCTESQKATVKALGLRKRNSEVDVADNSANRGQIFKVQHLVEVTPVK
jgi:large subunit ribosomal protein L30